MKTYRIVRMYQNPALLSEWIDTGLTLEEAEEHCKDPQASSKTAIGPTLTDLTQLFGEWFDGYEEES